MSQTHTRLPWHVYNSHEHWPGIEAKGQSIVIWGKKVEQCGVKGDNHDEAISNAALIVRAVNNHGSLVKALQIAEPMLVFGSYEASKQRDFEAAKRFTDTLEAVRTALRNAEEQP